jgi:hypothetical protein
VIERLASVIFILALGCSEEADSTADHSSRPRRPKPEHVWQRAEGPTPIGGLARKIQIVLPAGSETWVDRTGTVTLIRTKGGFQIEVSRIGGCDVTAEQAAQAKRDDPHTLRYDVDADGSVEVSDKFGAWQVRACRTAAGAYCRVTQLSPDKVDQAIAICKSLQPS